MIQNKFQLIVNIKSKGYTGTIPSVTANDNIVFDVLVYDGATPIDLTGVSRFTLVSMRKDNISVIREGTLVNSVIEFVLGSSETAESGRVGAMVQLYDADNKRVSSAPLVYNVISDPSLSGSLPADDKTLVIANESLMKDSIAQSEAAMENSLEAIEIASSAENKADMAESNAYNAVQTANSVKDEFDRVIAETGDSIPEIVQARGTEVNLNARITKLDNQLIESTKQSQMLEHGLSVINASMDSPVDVEVQGRTLVSLSSSILDAAKNYVLADKKTKLKSADASTVQGVAKFAGKSEKPALVRIANFEGKVSGSTVENPHKAYGMAGGSLISPSSFDGEFDNSNGYVKAQTQDGLSAITGLTGVSAQAEHGFSFDIISEIECQLGRIPKATLADKVQWCKDNIASLALNWFGFGSSVGGNKATLTVFNFTENDWHEYRPTNQTSSISKIVYPIAEAFGVFIDSTGFAHFLAYAEASDGVTPSTISTDYVELAIELKPDAVLHDPLVPLYEVDSTEYSKILVDWNEAEVLNRYPKVQGIQHLQNVYAIAEGENLLPPFSEWTLHDNAKVISPYELELNANGSFQASNCIMEVIPNTVYTFSIKDLVVDQYYYAMELDKNNEYSLVLTTLGQPGDYDITFTTKPTTVRLNIVALNTDGSHSIGTFIFKNPMLTLGSVANPFVPRNPSYVFSTVKLGQIGTAKDMLYKQDGQWYVRKAIEKDVVLDGKYDWSFQVDFDGSKRFVANVVNPNESLSSQLSTKYDGKVLKFGAINEIDGFFLQPDNGYYHIVVSDLETGYGETYNPTSDEIQAYFNGWQAKTVDGTGKPTSWRNLGDGTDAQTQTLAYVSANKAPNFTPYKLSYVLATPQIVTAQVEGDIAVNGLTQVEVGSGVIVREKVMPQKDSTKYYISSKNQLPYWNVSKTQNNVSRFIAVYKNGKFDIWTFEENFATIDQSQYDSTAEYTVTYLVLDRYLFTNNATEFTAKYNSSLKSVVDNIVENQTDLFTQSSINVQAIAELYKRVKALGG